MSDTPKISTLLIGCILVSLFAVCFNFLIVDASSKYGVTYNNTELDSFNKFSELNTQMNELEEKSSTVKAQTGLLDRIGAMFEAGYGIIKASYTSMTITKDMSSAAFKKVDLGGTEAFFNIAMTLIIVAIFVVMIVLKLIVKGET